MDDFSNGGRVKKRVYVETSVISYLTARDSTNIIKRGMQEATRKWWNHRSSFDLYVSNYVREEIRFGDPEAARLRVKAAADLKSLEVNQAVLDVTDELINKGAVPSNFRSDAGHIAMSAVHKMDFLATWNQAHIVNSERMNLVQTVIRDLGFVPPGIVRPEYFLQEDDYND